MVFLRIFGTWFLLVAVIALVYDGTRTLASSDGLVVTALGEHWFRLHPSSLGLAQAAIERHVHPFLWDPVILTILQMPAWVVLGVIGLGLYLLGRKRKRIDIYSN